MIFLVVSFLGGLSLFISGFVLLFSACPEVSFTRSGGGRTILIGVTCYDEAPLGTDTLPGWGAALILIFGGVAVATFPFWGAPLFVLGERIRDWMNTPRKGRERSASDQPSHTAVRRAAESAQNKFARQMNDWARQTFREIYLRGFIEDALASQKPQPNWSLTLRSLYELHVKHSGIALSKISSLTDSQALLDNGIYYLDSILPGEYEQSEVFKEAIDTLHANGLRLPRGERTASMLSTAWTGVNRGMEERFFDLIDGIDSQPPPSAGSN